MERPIVGLCLFVLLAACSPGPQSPASHISNDAAEGPTASAPPTSGPPAPVHTCFDPEASRRIMEARAEFDAAELAAFDELDRIMGGYRHQMQISREQYVRHLAGEAVPATRSAAWTQEHENRAAYARSVVDPQIRAARARLERETLLAMQEFFARELQARRMARVDYLRYTREIRKGEFAEFRGRKWTGPAVYEFRGTHLSPEYRKVLQEVRLLWQAQGRRASVITHVDTNQEFYRTLVPRE